MLNSLPDGSVHCTLYSVQCTSIPVSWAWSAWRSAWRICTVYSVQCTFIPVSWAWSAWRSAWRRSSRACTPRPGRSSRECSPETNFMLQMKMKIVHLPWLYPSMYPFVRIMLLIPIWSLFLGWYSGVKIMFCLQNVTALSRSRGFIFFLSLDQARK